MRKTLFLTAALGLVMGVGTAAMADSPWTGGDNLPTSRWPATTRRAKRRRCRMTAARRPALRI